MKSIEEVGEFEKLLVQTALIADQFAELSKRKPNDVVNRFKLDLVNGLLRTANEVFDDKHKPFEDFCEFDEGHVPVNSDVLLVLVQYQTFLRQFKAANVGTVSVQGDFGLPYEEPRWLVNGRPSKLKA
jgi:hypothetical protein